MSVLNMSNSDTEKLFLEYITPAYKTFIRENAVLADKFRQDSKSVQLGGKYATFKCLTNATPGRPSSSSTYPTSVQSVTDEFNIYMKRGYYDTMQFDGLAMACSKGDRMAIANIVEYETRGKQIAMANKLNQMYWGDGSGRLAQVVGAVSNSTTVIVDGPTHGQDANYRTNPAQYLFLNQYVDVYSTAGALECEEKQITAMTDNGDGTNTLTFSAAVTLSNNSYLFDHDTYAAAHAAGTGVPMGLEGILGTSDPYIGITQVYFQGVQRSTHPWAKTQSISNSSAAWDPENTMRLINECEKWGRIDFLITNEVIWRKIWLVMGGGDITQKETMKWEGVEGLAFYAGRKGKIPIIKDIDCPDNLIAAVDASALATYSPGGNGLTWIKGDKGILTQVAGKDEFSAQMKWYYNFGCENPQALGELTAVKHSAV
jgi:hypothetical protein